MGEFLELVRRRRSVRTYDGRGVPEALKGRLAAAADAGGFGGPVRLAWVTTDGGRKAGTYGMVTGCRDFLVAVVETPVDVRAAMEAGYRMEASVLEATAQGLGTCWLGGTLDRAGFSELAGCSAGEVVLASVAVGFGAEERWRDGVVRWVVNAGRRKGPEELFFLEDGRTPLRPEAEWEAEALEAVRWAPSAGNRQPWRVVREEGGYGFHLAPDRVYSAVFPWIQWVDMGIACRHWRMAVKLSGVKGSWSGAPRRKGKRGWIPVISWRGEGEAKLPVQPKGG